MNGGKQDAGISSDRFFQSHLQYGGSLSRQWCATLLAALAFATDVWARSQDKIFTTKTRYLKQTQAGLQGQQEQGMVATPDPRGLIGR